MFLSTPLKFLDHLTGFFLTLLLSTPRERGGCIAVCSILIIRPGGIGDAVLLLPMLYQLSLLYPGAKIEVLAESRNAEVFLWSSVVSKVWQYDRPLDFLRLFRQRYDLIIDTEQWYRLSAVVARLLTAPRVIGFATNERSRLLSDPCPYKQDAYEAVMFLRLLVPLDAHASGPPLEQSGWPVLPHPKNILNTPYVVIFPGSSVAAKQWPAERFAEVARFCENAGFSVVVLGGKTDVSVAKVVSNALNSSHNLAGTTSLTESAAIVAEAALYISGDSGLLHLAQLKGVPAVALFGPSNPKKWSREGDKHVVVSAGVACAPCSLYGAIPKCHHGFQCMQNITVDMVITAAICLLQKKAGSKSL